MSAAWSRAAIRTRTGRSAFASEAVLAVTAGASNVEAGAAGFDRVGSCGGRGLGGESEGEKGSSDEQPGI